VAPREQSRPTKTRIVFLWAFLPVCILSTYRINGKFERLRLKKIMRKTSFFLGIMATIIYIIALII